MSDTSAPLTPGFLKSTLNLAFFGMLYFNLPVSLNLVVLSMSLTSLIAKYFSAAGFLKNSPL